MPENRVRATVHLASAAWSMVLFLSGLKLTHGWAKVLNFLPLAIVGLFWVFDNWAWRWRFVKRLVKRPDLIGTWSGELTPLRNAAREVVHGDPIPVYLVVQESFLAMHVSLISAESRSRSVTSFLERGADDAYTVHYQYTNNPILSVRDRSPIHAGAARLEFGGFNPESLKGEYWTDRHSAGIFTLCRRTKEVFATWQDVEKKLGEKSKAT